MAMVYARIRLVAAAIALLILAVTAALLVNTFVAAPNEALQGVAVLFAGLPLYWYWSRKYPSAR